MASATMQPPPYPPPQSKSDVSDFDPSLIAEVGQARLRSGEGRVGGGQVGRNLPRLEAREKVTGRAEYTHNLRLPRMLYGKVFRSTVAHGRIKSIDASAAKAVPGVYRVVPAEAVIKVISHTSSGPAFLDQPIISIALYPH